MRWFALVAKNSGVSNLDREGLTICDTLPLTLDVTQPFTTSSIQQALQLQGPTRTAPTTVINNEGHPLHRAT
jgi:hypothetical protein